MTSTKPGFFLTVEGVEGVGKTTNVDFICKSLAEVGVDVVCTREPGGTPLAEELRQILLADRAELVDAHAELMLIFAARAQHLSRVILPALAAGRWVLCDRFTDATFAYQGGGRRLPWEVIAQLELMVQAGRQPDKTFFLDLDVETGLSRAKKRGSLDRFEKEDRSFFENVREGYWRRIHDSPERFAVIDASLDLADVQRQITAELKKLLADFGANGASE